MTDASYISCENGSSPIKFCDELNSNRYDQKPKGYSMYYVDEHSSSHPICLGASQMFWCPYSMAYASALCTLYQAFNLMSSSTTDAWRFSLEHPNQLSKTTATCVLHRGLYIQTNLHFMTISSFISPFWLEQYLAFTWYLFLLNTWRPPISEGVQ